MGVAKSHILNDTKKDKLRASVKRGAALFHRFLANKTFSVLCEDKSVYAVHFYKKDFLHFTGLSTDLSEDDFFQNALDRIIDNGNILTNQHYDWPTLKRKAKIVARINDVIYSGVNMVLLLNCLRTNTFTFPIAIRNDSFDACIAFVSDRPYARSVRTAHSSKNCESEKRIEAIFAAKDDDTVIDEIVFLRSKSAVIESELVDKLSSRLKERFKQDHRDEHV